MKSQELIRWSGLVTIITGILLLGFGVLPGLLLPIYEPLLNWVLDGQWFILNLSAFLLTVLIPISLLGIYAKQVGKIGKLGLVGFLMTYVGGMLYAGIQFEETFTWPILARHAPELININGPMFSDPAFSFAYMFMALLFIPGFIMFGIASIRTRIFPKWAVLLLIVGSPCAFGGFMVPQILRTIGSSLATAGFIRLGLTLFRDKGN